eukprot:1143963-Pelagomonas_calceolata.AAC.3
MVSTQCFVSHLCLRKAIFARWEQPEACASFIAYIGYLIPPFFIRMQGFELGYQEIQVQAWGPNLSAMALDLASIDPRIVVSEQE